MDPPHAPLDPLALPSAHGSDWTVRERLSDLRDAASARAAALRLEDLRDPKAVGVALALVSSLLVGMAFVITRKAHHAYAERAGTHGQRAGAGGHAYMREPLWLIGTAVMGLGEALNFVAYAYAPAVLVTPLGAISIIVSALLADAVLGEKLHVCGLCGTLACMGGSLMLVLSSPEERVISSVDEVWAMATQPAFLVYVTLALSVVLALALCVAPATVAGGGGTYGETQARLAFCTLPPANSTAPATAPAPRQPRQPPPPISNSPGSSPCIRPRSSGRSSTRE